MKRPTLPAYVRQAPAREEVIAGLLLRGIGMAVAMSAATVLWIDVAGWVG